MKAATACPRPIAPNAIQASTAPRLALTKPEAPEALGISDESFDRYVRPSPPAVAIGARRVYPLSLLSRWLEENAHVPLDDLDAALVGRKEHQ